jgi:hypothetical protein
MKKIIFPILAVLFLGSSAFADPGHPAYRQKYLDPYTKRTTYYDPVMRHGTNSRNDERIDHRSDLNGVCRFLGHRNAFEYEIKSHTDIWNNVLLDENGVVTGHIWGRHISKITCLSDEAGNIRRRDLNAPLQHYLYDNGQGVILSYDYTAPAVEDQTVFVVNPHLEINKDRPNAEQFPFTFVTNLNGLCLFLGYNSYVEHTVLISPKDSPKAMYIDETGKLTGAYQGHYIEEVGCKK